jgi:hypothetical protein
LAKRGPRSCARAGGARGQLDVILPVGDKGRGGAGLDAGPQGDGDQR